MQIRQPYLLFLGDAPDSLAAKVADGVARWRPQWCVGQLRLEGCRADVGLPDLSLESGLAAGARTLVIGVANRGGVIPDLWLDTLVRALDLGYDLAAGLHTRLQQIPQLSRRAAAAGRHLFDVRYPDLKLSVASGQRRSGRRLLTVGTDCSVGKMFTSLALEREMTGRGMRADFRATGQTGILIAGEGIAVDAVIADFISGATEMLSPDHDADHWDLIEGQGSLFHASYAGVTLGLIHGAQPDCMVLCHEPTRTHMRGLPGYPLPSLADCIRANEAAGRLTNPACAVVGISVNTAALDQEAARVLLGSVEAETGLPAVDAYRQGAGRLVDAAVAHVSIGEGR